VARTWSSIRVELIEDRRPGTLCPRPGRVLVAAIASAPVATDREVVACERDRDEHPLQVRFGFERLSRCGIQPVANRNLLTKRAKGILMERHSIDENSAFEMLRERSRLDNRKLIDLAAAVVDGHRPTPQAAAGSRPALTPKQLAQPGDSHRRERPGPRRARSGANRRP
jgi:hypothetical protein